MCVDYSVFLPFLPKNAVIHNFISNLQCVIVVQNAHLIFQGDVFTFLCSSNARKDYIIEILDLFASFHIFLLSLSQLLTTKTTKVERAALSLPALAADRGSNI